MSKNYKGGYKLISLNGVDLITMALGVVINGIYARIEASYRKALMLTGIVVNGVEKNDIIIDTLRVVSGDYVITAYGYDITITSDDEVTATIHEEKPKFPYFVISGEQAGTKLEDLYIEDGYYKFTATGSNFDKILIIKKDNTHYYVQNGTYMAILSNSISMGNFKGQLKDAIAELPKPTSNGAIMIMNANGEVHFAELPGDASRKTYDMYLDHGTIAFAERV